MSTQRIEHLKELGLQQLTFNINDDILEVLEAKEGDHRSRGLAIQILKNNEEIDTTGVDVDLYAKPKDGQTYLVRGIETDVTRGMYEIMYPSAILQPGEVEVEIVLTQGEQVISTKKFSLIVEDTLATDDIVEKSDERPLLAILVEAGKNENTRIEAENRRIALENERAKNENARQSNERIRETNEEIRKVNEDTRQANENVRKSQESGRMSAEATREANEDSRKGAEATRKSNEDKRIAAENERVKNENTRKSNENTRIANEDKRKENMAIVESWIENPEQFDGRDLEYRWSGTKLGVRLEGETEYQYVDLKGEKGDKGDKGDRGPQGLKGDIGKGLEFSWDGTRLGIRQEGQIEYQYVDLKGEKGDPGEGSGDMHTTTYDKNRNGIVDRAEVADTLDGKSANMFAHSARVPSEDLNDVTRSGMYRLNDGLINAPEGVEWGQLLVIHGDGDTVTQIVSDYRSDKIYWRSGNPENVGGKDSWKKWRLIWHEGNFNPSNKADKAYVDGNFATKEELSKAGKVQSVNNKTGSVVLTKSDIGLGNVDNARQATKTEFNAHTSNKSNPHGVTKSHVGLGNVTNIAQASKSEFNNHVSKKITSSGGIHGLEIKTGTFTPYIFGQGTKGSNSYRYREGRYMTIGDLVIIMLRVRLNSKDSRMAGVLNIGGLPYKTSFYSALTVAQIRGIKTSYGTETTATVNQMADYPDAIYLYKQSYSDADKNVYNVYAEDITDSFGVYITGMYLK